MIDFRSVPRQFKLSGSKLPKHMGYMVYMTFILGPRHGSLDYTLYLGNWTLRVIAWGVVLLGWMLPSSYEWQFA